MTRQPSACKSRELQEGGIVCCAGVLAICRSVLPQSLAQQRIPDICRKRCSDLGFFCSVNRNSVNRSSWHEALSQLKLTNSEPELITAAVRKRRVLRALDGKMRVTYSK